MSIQNQKDLSKTKKIEPFYIVGIILIVLFLPIICINMTLVIKGWVNPEEVPMIFNRSILFVKSDSMAINDVKSESVIYKGAFNKDDLIFIKKVEFEDLKVNDIITYKIVEGDKITLITHRIRAIEENPDYYGGVQFITAGDTLNPGSTYQRDPVPVSYDMIVGIYTGRAAGFGKIADFLQSWQGILILIGLPVLIIFVVEIISNNNSNKSNTEKDQELERLTKELEELRKKEAERKEQSDENN